MAGPRVAVVGAGAWGTTLARLIGGVEPVTLLCHSSEVADEISRTRRNERRLPGIDLPERILASADPAALTDAVDLVVRATPSRHLRGTVALVAPRLAPSADLVSVVKGLEAGSLLRMSEVIADAGGLPPERIAALSGPNLALEIARGCPPRRSSPPRIRSWRSGSLPASGAVNSASTSTATSWVWSCAVRSRTSSPSPPVLPMPSGSETTARPG